MGNKWTNEEEVILKTIYKDYSIKELAEILNKTVASIDCKKRRLGLTENVQNKNRGDQNFFNEIDTEEKAYWLGFIYADGYIIKSERNYELGIELNYKDVEHLNKFNSIFNNYYKVTKKIKNYNSIDILNGHEPTNKKSEMCLIRVYSKSIYEGLNKNGIVQNKTYSNIFPKIEDKYLFLHFLRGYIDGDGSYIIKTEQRQYKTLKEYKYPKIAIQGNNLNIFEYIVEKLQNDFNIKAHIYKDRKCYKLEVARKNDCLKLINLMYDNATIYLDRKFEIINKIKSIAV